MTTASDERKRWFGWLSVELLVQFAVMVFAFGAGYAYLSADVRVNMKEVQSLSEKMSEQSRLNSEASAAQAKAITDAASDARMALTNLAQQRGEISALQQSRDADRKLLMDISSNVAVLLDRTDPRKKTP